MADKVITIELNEYDHTCGDGCCHLYGIETTIDGVELLAHNIDLETQLRQILEHLGHEVTIITRYNGEEC